MCCSVNASMGKEFEDKDLYSKSIKKKNIVVIGSGPVGMGLQEFLVNEVMQLRY